MCVVDVPTAATIRSRAFASRIPTLLPVCMVDKEFLRVDLLFLFMVPTVYSWLPPARFSHAVIVSVLLRSCSARAPERVVRARSARARASWNRRAGMGMGMAAMLSSMARLQQHGGMVASRLFTVELQRQSADAVPCGAWSAWLASCSSWVLCCCSQSSWR